MTLSMLSTDELAKIHKAAFHNKRSWRLDEIQSLIDDETVLCLCNNHGFVMLRVIPPEAEILTIAIDPIAQNQGHGQKLVQAAKNAMTERSVAEIFLEMEKNDSRLRTFYEAQGFRTVGRREKYYKWADGQFTDALIMRCNL